MCHLWVGNRILFFFVRWVKKLKHIRVGNECRAVSSPVRSFVSSLFFKFIVICRIVIVSPLVHNLVDRWNNVPFISIIVKNRYSISKSNWSSGLIIFPVSLLIIFICKVLLFSLMMTSFLIKNSQSILV